MFGAYSINSSRFIWKRSDRGNSKTFIKFLHQLRQRYKSKRIFLILDNASYHKSAAVKCFLLRYPEITLFFLPPYSPEYNPVEQIWGWLKRKICRKSSKNSIDSVVSSIRKWCWHWRENNLTSSFQVGLGIWRSLVIK